MASSSTSKYDVFISFRGEDTRNGFISHLAAALHRKQIEFFIDDEELKKGDEISPTIMKAIKASDLSIIIFSKNYASSRWCLNELVKILECKKMNDQIVIPIFYHIDPSDVRKQRRSFQEAFEEHEKNLKEMTEKVQKWRAALIDASNISGYEFTKTRNEAELVEKIVVDISKKLEDISDSADLHGFVGLNSQIEKIKSLLCLEFLDVQIVGIWGMGGIGKTTIASVVFHQISRKFQGDCFMANVREESYKMGVIQVRDEVISQVLGENLKIGTSIIPPKIKKRLQRMKVLIVLDDVHDEFTQLDSLTGGLDLFSRGSRIIVTTRDKRVLDKCGVNKVYEVKGLKHNQALELFWRKAFRQNNRSQDLLELSEQVVWYAHGNPLALQVLGASFYQKSKQQWKDKLDNLKLVSEPNIYNVLKISYDELSSEEKKIFLDMACFFKGEDIDLVRRIQDEPTTLTTLVDKSLIKISIKKIQMHDLLQEMGQAIVRQKSIKKRTRLWDHQDVYHVLKKNKDGTPAFHLHVQLQAHAQDQEVIHGTDKIEGIFLDLSKTEDIHLSSQAFAKMPNLRLLKFYMPDRCGLPIEDSRVYLDQGLEYLSKKLRYLHWHQYPLKTLPLDFKPKNLIELNLPYSKIEQLWEGKKKAFKLKSIDLSNSQYLTRMSDPSKIPNLERTNFSNCTNLTCIPSSMEKFNQLSLLCFKGCKSLRSFSSNLHFVCQVTIDFNSCINLTEFPKISGKIKKLDLRNTAIQEVPSSIECLNDLEVLDLSCCTRLKNLSTSICKLKSLLELLLNDCFKLESFPEILEKMEHLKEIHLQRTAIKELPSSIENLEGLEVLFLHDCSKLFNLPDNIGNLKSLQYIFACGSSIGQLPSSVADSNELNATRRGLVSLPRLLLSGVSSMVELELRDCAVIEIPEDIGCLSSLKLLDLRGNHFKSLPATIKQLSQLRWLGLCDCNMLQSLPELPLFLEHLEARNCKRLQSLPRIPSCLQELDATVLEKLSNHSYKTENKRLSMEFLFTNCMKLNETANSMILEDSQLRIQHMAIASLRLFYEEEFCELRGPGIFLPGSKIPEWFSDQSSGSSIALQLPQHSCRNLIGFAFCAVLDFKPVFAFSIDNYYVRCRYSCEIKTVSETKHVYRVSYVPWIPYSLDSDHVILGFDPCRDVVLPDKNHHKDFSFEFSSDSYKVKCCGVCPVYANPNETRPDTFALKFAAGSDKECTSTAVSASVDEDGLEPNPKRICRDQISIP